MPGARGSPTTSLATAAAGRIARLLVLALAELRLCLIGRSTPIRPISTVGSNRRIFRDTRTASRITCMAMCIARSRRLARSSTWARCRIRRTTRSSGFITPTSIGSGVLEQHFRAQKPDRREFREPDLRFRRHVGPRGAKQGRRSLQGFAGRRQIRAGDELRAQRRPGRGGRDRRGRNGRDRRGGGRDVVGDRGCKGSIHGAAEPLDQQADRARAG